MVKARCTVPDCGSPGLARGWCSSHYQRFRKYGDPLAGGKTPTRSLDNPDGSRTCKTCQKAKPIEEFPLDLSATRGRKGECKPCWSTKASAWYAANRERQLAKHIARRDANRDRVRQQDRARYERDKPKRLALVVDAGNRRRAILRHGGPWDRGITCRALRTRDGDECCYCGVRMTFAPASGHKFVADKATVEHVVPISAGGTHTWDNVLLACWQCNVRKQSRPIEEWLTNATELRRVRRLLPGAATQLEILFGELS